MINASGRPAARGLRRADGRSRSTSAPRAPRAMAAATKPMPVETLAADRHEEITRPNRPRVDRDAVDRPSIRASHVPAVRRSRPRCPRRSAAADPRVYDTLEPARRRASAVRATSTSSNGNVRSPMTWYFSCPFPAISTRSPAARVAHGTFDGASCDRGSRDRASISDARAPSAVVAIGGHDDAALDLVDDLIRILRSRVVGRDDDEIAQPGGDRAHERPLRAIAIAAASEHRDHPAGCERPRRLQQVLQRVVGVRVIDDHSDIVGGSETT